MHGYSLLLYSGSLYVIGRVPGHNETIYLSLPRFRKVQLLEKTFERDESFSLKEFIKGSFGIWYEEPEDIEILFDKTVRQSIENRHWHPTQKIVEQKNGDIILKMHIGPSKELLAWVLRWGEYAEVLAPHSLRRDVRRSVRATIRRYRESSRQ